MDQVFICPCFDFWTLSMPGIFKIASKHQYNLAVAADIPYISPPYVNHVVMTSELTVRCPLFTGCHGSSEKAHS